MAEGMNETIAVDQVIDFEQVRARVCTVSPSEVAELIGQLASDEVAAVAVESIQYQQVVGDELVVLEAALEERIGRQQDLEKSLLEIKANYSQTIATLDLESEALDQRQREVLATKVIIYRGHYNATVKTFNELQAEVAQLNNRRTQIEAYLTSSEYVEHRELLQHYQQVMGSVALLAETLQLLRPLTAVPPAPAKEREPASSLPITGSIDPLELDGITTSQRHTIYYDVVMPSAMQDAAIETVTLQEQPQPQMELPPLLLPAQLQKRLDGILAAVNASVGEVVYE